MARAGVTYHDVVKAAEAIKTQGQEPTVDRVREHLGTGSKSTIAPLLKRWRSDNGAVADIGGLPNDLVAALKSLHERLQQEADHRIEQARQEFKETNDELRKELADASNTISQYSTHQKELEKQIEQLTEEKKLQSQSVEELRVALAKMESKRDEAIARATDLKETVTELKQENKDIRDHFEHYQQRTAEDRQQERDQFRITNQQLQDQIQDLRGQLDQAESRSSELVDIKEQLQRSVGDLEQANATLNGELGRKTEEIRSLKSDLDEAVKQNQESQNINGQLAKQITALTSQKAEADKEVAVLSLALETAKSELKTSQDKVVFLNDENKVILQEKAVIKGQFKQLQESLQAGD
jgi:chromosome segregation ATPase